MTNDILEQITEELDKNVIDNFLRKLLINHRVLARSGCYSEETGLNTQTLIALILTAKNMHLTTAQKDALKNARHFA